MPIFDSTAYLESLYCDNIPSKRLYSRRSPMHLSAFVLLRDVLIAMSFFIRSDRIDAYLPRSWRFWSIIFGELSMTDSLQ